LSEGQWSFLEPDILLPVEEVSPVSEAGVPAPDAVAEAGERSVFRDEPGAGGVPGPPPTGVPGQGGAPLFSWPRIAPPGYEGLCTLT
jgi:hypothetical protein